jgi:PAS domain S-box-containing protein
MRLRAKLLVVLIPLSLASGAGILLMARRAVGTVLIDSVAQRAFVGITGLAPALSNGMRAKDERIILPLLNAALRETGASYAMALDVSGVVLAHTNIVEKGKTYGDPATRRALDYMQPGFQLLVDDRGAPILDVGVPVWAADEDFILAHNKGGQSRIGTLRLGLPLKQALATRASILGSLGLILLLTGGVLGAIVMLFMRHVLRPVRLLAESAGRIGRGQIGVTVPVLSQDELGELAGAFNRMAKDLENTTVSRDKLVAEIAEREAAQSAMADANRRMQAVLDGSQWVSIIATDLAGKILLFSKGAEKLLGYSADEMVGKQTPASFHLESEVRARAEEVSRESGRLVTGFEAIVAAAMGGDCEEREWTHVRKDGTHRQVILSLSPLRDAAGGIVGILGTAVDITERKKLESQLTQSEKMSAIGRLAGGVAHDFNNLLTAITGYGSFLLQNLPQADQNHQDVEEIMKAAERAAALTRQLLAFSRRQILQPAILDLNMLLGNIAKMLKRLIGEDVQLVLQLAPVLSRVKADPGQLEQVVMNLAVNARDAMPRGGMLTIETADVHFKGIRTHEGGNIPPGRYAMIAVSDTGAGMSREVQSHIFEPFFTTKAQGKGTGLGLAMVHGIVTQSGGAILVYSEEGRGTSFKVYLPIVDDLAQSPTPDPPVSATRGGNETILLVEDDAAALEVAQRALQAKGYQILRTESPDDALSICADHKGPIHLLLTDMVMPGMDGIELAGRLSRLRSGIKVLCMSGYTEHAALRQGLLTTRRSFIQKPFLPEQLCAKVREVLDAKSEGGAGREK